MQPSKHAPIYQAYLLRLWRADDHAPWRASLQAPGTLETHGFANLETLFAFLHAQMAAERTSEPAADGQHSA